MPGESKGRKAREILESEVFIEAREIAAQYIKDEWAHESSAARRESLWHQIQGVNPLVRALKKIAGDGDVAAFERKRQEKLNG